MDSDRGLAMTPGHYMFKENFMKTIDKNINIKKEIP